MHVDTATPLGRRETVSVKTSAGKVKFTDVDTNYAERPLNDSFFPVRLDPFFVEN